jgi:hypothetical protein
MLENRLANDELALESMKRAHKAYGEARWELLTPEDQTEIESRQWERSPSAECWGCWYSASLLLLNAYIHILRIICREVPAVSTIS